MSEMGGVIHASEVRVGVFPVADPVAHLDEDWAVPCEFGRKLVTCQGDNPAEFILWLTPCSCCARVRPILACKPCLDDILGDEVNVCCSRCKAAYLPASTAIRLIEPLNRRTT